MIVVGVIALAGVTGCGSTHAASGSGSGSPSGVLSGDVTFASAHSSALVRVFTAAGRMVEHQGVSSGHGQFRFVLAPGDYQVLLKVTRGQLVRPGDSGCATESAQVQAHHTTQIRIGRTCGSTT